MRTVRFAGAALACGAVLMVGVRPSLAQQPALHTASGCGGGPSVIDIGNAMSRTVEARNSTVHFTASSLPITVPDGHGGGTVTAIVGRRFPSPNGRGELVFFWHGTTFVGWDTKFENRSARISGANQGTFTITYNGNKTVHFAWSSNHIFISDGIAPGQKSGGTTVRRLP